MDHFTFFVLLDYLLGTEVSETSLDWRYIIIGKWEKQAKHYQVWTNSRFVIHIRIRCVYIYMDLM